MAVVVLGKYEGFRCIVVVNRNGFFWLVWFVEVLRGVIIVFIYIRF